jgi:hypothetical protein
VFGLTKGSGVTGIDANGNIYGTYVDGQGVAHGYIDVGGSFQTIDYPDAKDTLVLHVSATGLMTGAYVDASGGTIGFTGQVDLSAPTDVSKIAFTSYQAPSLAPPEISVGSDNGLTFAGIQNNDIDLVTAEAACYAKGTRLLSLRGEIAIESLRVDDALAVASGGFRPVVWLGRRRLDLRRHPRPQEVRPVRVAAHAFGEGIPRRDLRLSPGHNIAVDGVLMPISALVNGVSVVQETPETVEYWHIELDAHDIVLAEGLPAESYLDCGNRTAFETGGAFLEAHPDFQPKHWRETCLPLHKDGPRVVEAKRRLLARLAERGCEIVDDADPHLLADGLRIEPIRISERRLAFTLPEGCQSVRLASRTFVPAHVVADSDDRRELGLSLARLQIDGDDVALDDPRLPPEDWNDAELEGGRVARRWSRAASALPAGARLVVLDLVGRGFYWRERVEPGEAFRSA